MTRLGGLSLALVWLLVACGEGSTEGEAAARVTPDARATRVEVATLRQSEAVLSMALPGEVEGSRDALLASAMGGLVESVKVDKGDVVKRGQTLVRIDAALYGAQVAQAEAQRIQAEAELERVKKMGDLASPQQVLQAETSAKVAAAAEQQARVQLSRASIVAPFSGTVADVSVEKGEFAAPGSPVVRLVQLDPVTVNLSVSDRDIGGLVQGAEVTVQASALASSRAGEVAHIGQAANLRTRAFPVEVAVPNPDGALKPGMIARVTVERVVRGDAFVVPQDWIVTRRDKRGVFVVDEGDVARWVSVELGDLVHEQVVVTGGLSGDERIIITGHRELLDGDAILITREGTCCFAGRPRFGAAEEG